MCCMGFKASVLRWEPAEIRNRLASWDPCRVHCPVLRSHQDLLHTTRNETFRKRKWHLLQGACSLKHMEEIKQSQTLVKGGEDRFCSGTAVERGEPSSVLIGADATRMGAKRREGARLQQSQGRVGVGQWVSVVRPSAFAREGGLGDGGP